MPHHASLVRGVASLVDAWSIWPDVSVPLPLPEHFGDLRVSAWLSGIIFQEILLGDIGDISCFFVFGQEMIEGLISVRP